MSKTKDLTIKTVVSVEGMEWPVDISLKLHANGLTQFRELLEISLRGLLASGFRPRGNELDRPTGQAEAPPMAEPAALVIPKCVPCKRDMAHSKVQKKGPDIIAYYCPGKVASGYCLWRGSVNTRTGEIKTWEMKE